MTSSSFKIATCHVLHSAPSRDFEWCRSLSTPLPTIDEGCLPCRQRTLLEQVWVVVLVRWRDGIRIGRQSSDQNNGSCTSKLATWAYLVGRNIAANFSIYSSILLAIWRSAIGKKQGYYREKRSRKHVYEISTTLIETKCCVTDVTRFHSRAGASVICHASLALLHQPFRH